jgi:hypothetical protein
LVGHLTHTFSEQYTTLLFQLCSESFLISFGEKNGNSGFSQKEGNENRDETGFLNESAFKICENERK